MREEDEIRAAVIALAEAQESGENIAAAPRGAAGAELRAADSVAPPLFAKGDDPAVQREAALAAVFDAVRVATRRGCLSRPVEWETAGLVPPSMTPEDLEMAVYDALMGCGDPCGLRGAEETAASKTEGAMFHRPPNEHVKSAFSSSNGRTVGVPPFKRKSAAAVAPTEERSPDCMGVSREEQAPAAVSPSPEAVGAHPVPVCANIRLLMGATSYYLYDSEVMTDAYARWAFLAAEDDPVATFVECVREESSVYPRPMAASSLANEPFCIDAAAVEEAFAAARAQRRADDIARIEASNGDVYFYSTRFLSSARAAALAEWDAVERRYNV